MPPDPRARPLEVLLVEDNPADAELIAGALMEGGMVNRITIVEDGEEALDVLHRRGRHPGAPRPDLVLLDLNLPRKSGLEVLACAKSDPRLAAIPVVVLTTSESDEDVLRTYSHYANCYVTKPVELERFYSVIHAIEHFWFSVARLPPG